MRETAMHDNRDLLKKKKMFQTKVDWTFLFKTWGLGEHMFLIFQHFKLEVEFFLTRKE
jgi:hypothetical protein